MIGIVTPYKVPNYGTKLQAYAMQELIGQYDDVEIINFVGASDYRPRAVLGKVKLRINNRNLINKNIEAEKYRKIRVESIHKFDVVYYRFSEKIKGTLTLQKKMKGYYAVVCGSDQLWAPLNVDADYFTLTIVPKGVPRISFSSSFGISNIPQSYHKAYKRFLKKMDAISVRETSGKTIVKDIVGRDATVTLDPTLMLSKKIWEMLAEKSMYNLKKYIFCYFLGGNSKHREFAKELSRRTGCKIVIFPHCKQFNEADVGFADMEILDAQPQDFVNLIRNADYVCTDSFHGTAFSTIFEKDVAVFERFSNTTKESTNSRIYSLLQKLDMESMLMKDAADVDKFMVLELNRERIKELLEMEKKKSFSYLDNALKLQRKN